MVEPSSYSASLGLRDEIEAYSKVLDGVIDLQLHLAPDVVKRACDDVEFAQLARQVGYRAFLLKSHHMITADRAYLLRRMVPGVNPYGGITLNHAVGGLNPDAVESAIMLGAKQVWMPTFSATNHLQFFKTPTLPGLSPVSVVREKRAPQQGIGVLTAAGEVKPEVLEILDLIAKADIILGTGHVSLHEVNALVESARKAGVKKILITHPEFSATNWSVDVQLKLAEMGAILEHCAVANYDPKLVSHNIKRVGAHRCVLSSDAGQVAKGHPADVMRKLIEDLMAEGIGETEIWAMTRENPARLLNLT